MRLQRVSESDLTDLLPLVQDYCRFNGVERTDQELLALSRALIADPDREGVRIIARVVEVMGRHHQLQLGAQRLSLRAQTA
jgi:hypothetical protein